MTPAEALTILDRMSAAATAQRPDHIAAVRAIEVLSEALGLTSDPTAPTPTDSPTPPDASAEGANELHDADDAR